MYDRLTARYTFPCPRGRELVRVPLSAFRTLERLAGAAHPAVYEVRFSCPCGGEHESLVAHDDLDWAPVGATDAPHFYNVMTGRLEPAAPELDDRAASAIQRGRWPWCFFCYAEDRPQPVFPSAFRLVAPRGGRIVLAARCPACARTSVNVVSREHLDVPFYSDREVEVVECLFPRPAESDLRPLAEALVDEFPTGPRLLAA